MSSRFAIQNLGFILLAIRKIERIEVILILYENSCIMSYKGGEIMYILYMDLIDDEVDKLKYSEFFENYERKLFGYSMSILHNEALSEEAVSETFLSLAIVFHKIHDLEPAEILAYTVIINRNACYDIIKKEKKHAQNTVAYDNIEDSIDLSYNDDIESRHIVSTVEELPVIYRDVIMLKYFYGFSVKEIAKQLHLSVGGVKSRLETARKMLGKKLE